MKRIVCQVLENQKGKVRTWRYSSGSNSRKLLTLPGPWDKGKSLGLIKHRPWKKCLEELGLDLWRWGMGHLILASLGRCNRGGSEYVKKLETRTNSCCYSKK